MNSYEREETATITAKRSTFHFQSCALTIELYTRVGARQTL